MILRFDKRLAFIAVFGAAQLLGACARKKSKKADSVETTADAGSGEQAPPPDEDDGGDDAPGQADEPGDKSIVHKDPDPNPDPNPDPKPDPTPDPKPSSYGQTVDLTVASIQAKLLDVYCVACHRGESPKAGLDLTSLASHLDGTVRDSYQGRLVVPGAPGQSMLALVIDPAVAHSQDIPLMPPPLAAIPAVTAAQALAVKTFIRDLAGSGAADVSDTGDGVGGGDRDGNAGNGGGDDGRGDALDPGIDL